MNVVPLISLNLELYPNDPDAILNDSPDIAILSVPSKDEISHLLFKFEDELRKEILKLWKSPHPTVVSQFGQLGIAKKNNERLMSNAWGLLPKAFAQAKGLSRIRSKAVIEAINRSGIYGHRKFGVRRTSGGDSIYNYLSGLNYDTQVTFFEFLLSPGCDLDEIVSCAQGTRLGIADLKALLEGKSGDESLSIIAAELETALNTPVGWSENGAERWYAPIWFASFLVTESIWLLPLEISSMAVGSYPGWARSIQLRMCLPDRVRTFADTLFKDFIVAPETQNSRDRSLVVLVAISVALSTNIFQLSELSAGPLVGYKKYYLTRSSGSDTHRSWAVNLLWSALLEFHGQLADFHPDGHAFVLGKRLVSKGTRPFNWTRNPNPKSLKLYSKIYGESPSKMPDWLVEWADHFEELLPLFAVENVKSKIDSLNYWLLYLVGLSAPPMSMQEVVRSTHVNAGGNPTQHSFRDFLVANFANAGGRGVTDAMTTMRQAWALSAELDGFSARLANPFDSGDSPFANPVRHSRTVRKAMDSRVMEIVARENMRDGMAFAKAHGGKNRTSWRTIRNPRTGMLEEVFFPGIPTLIHTVLHTGMRGMQARWLDSGEGDEFVPNPTKLEQVSNPLATATASREEGFLRLYSVIGAVRETVLGMWINSGKSGPHGVPWIHEDLIEPIARLIEFQTFWYPISAPTKIQSSLDFDAKFAKSKGYSYPLYRDPVNKLGMPISANRIGSYWRSLLKHCQPIVDLELGYNYPLILVDGSLNFDIHSLRVSVITTLLENGVPVTVVQMLVGHKSPLMTWYYQDVTNHKIHSALQRLIERKKLSFKNPHDMNIDDENSLVAEHVTLRSEEDFVGDRLLREHRESGGFIDVFSHGICAGGNCEQGGERFSEGRYNPVWRPRACSGCRFRITGPAFLNGLVQRANSLMWEIKTSFRREEQINADIEMQEDSGRSFVHLQSQIRAETESRDTLFNEWCLEIKTIQIAQSYLKAETGDSSPGNNSLIAGTDAREMTTRLREVHEFELVHRIVADSRIVDGQIDIPPDAILYRDDVLHRIANTNSVGGYFYSLDLRSRQRAMDAFSELLIEHSTSSENLQGIIDGSILLKEIPGLSNALAEGFPILDGDISEGKGKI